jgi:formate dehydrogenase gamma subunit
MSPAPPIIRQLQAVLLLGALSLIAPANLGAARADEASEACMTCHSNPELARESGGTLFVDTKLIARSAHAKLSCVRCHADARTIPHESRLAEVRCVTCHAPVARALEKSVHGRATGGGDRACAGCHAGRGPHDVRAAPKDFAGCVTCHPRESGEFAVSVHGVAIENGDSEAATCWSCHGAPHAVQSRADAGSPTSRERLAATCAGCHADRELMVRRKITIPEATALYEQSVHGRSQNRSAATCNDCHESHRLKPATDPTSSINRGNIARTCGRCHGEQARAYQASIHGTALERGVLRAPTCTDCHGEHKIRGPRDADSPVTASSVTRTCAHCHEAQGIRETYGLPAGRLGTYQDSFHGLAARGGSPAVANCASCHGEHDVLPSSDPRSAIHPGKLPATCGKCHPGAGEKFALGPVHVAAVSDDRLLTGVRWLYLLLIVGTIGGMMVHNGLDYVSKLRRHLGRQWGRVEEQGHALGAGVERWFERMTPFERIQHALLAVSFFVLVYTGFALKFPEAWPFAWLARLEHGYAWRSLVHRVAAVIMVASALLHVVYLVTRRGRSTVVALLPRPQDLLDVWGNLLYMLGRRDQPPAFRRFGYIEKAEYWALIWGTVVMTVTGVVLWFENQSLQVLSKRMLDLATLVHYYEAWLAFLAIMVWHVYQNVFNPDVYPMNWAWLHGRISDEQLRHEHRGEWEELAAAELRTEPIAASAAGRAESPSMATPGDTGGGPQQAVSDATRAEDPGKASEPPGAPA